MSKLEDYAYVVVSESHKKFTWRKRYISLQEGVLSVFKDKKEALKQKIPLIGVTKIEERNKERVIAIFSTELQKPFILKPTVETQLEEWARLIESEFHSPTVPSSRRNTITINANAKGMNCKSKKETTELPSGTSCAKPSAHSSSSSSSSIQLTKKIVNTVPRNYESQAKRLQHDKQKQKEQQASAPLLSTSPSNSSKTLHEYLSPISAFEQRYHTASETYIGGEHAGTVSMIIRKDGKRVAIRRVPTIFKTQSVPYMKHRNITKVFDTFETPEGLIVCEEFMDQGTLGDVFAAQDILQLTEAHLSYLLYESISAVTALHSLGIIHGRITSDSFLLNAKGKVKLSLLNAENQWQDKEKNHKENTKISNDEQSALRQERISSPLTQAQPDICAKTLLTTKQNNQDNCEDKRTKDEFSEKETIYAAPERILCSPANAASDVWSIGAVAAEACGITKTDALSIVLNGLSPLPRNFIFSTLCRRCFTESAMRPTASSLLRNSVFDTKANNVDFIQYCNERIKTMQEKQ